MTKKTILDYQRQQEVLFDIAMDVGSTWHKIDLKTRETLMDQLNGSRGLFDLVVQWVEEFDQEWEAGPNDPDKQYLESVSEFTANKLLELVESTRSHVGSKSAERAKKTHLARYDEYARKIAALESVRITLSPRELGWLITTRDRIVMEVDLKVVTHLVICASVLASKKIYDLKQAGFSYMDLSTALGLSVSRTSVLAKAYLRERHMNDTRIKQGRPTNMPWL